MAAGDTPLKTRFVILAILCATLITSLITAQDDSRPLYDLPDAYVPVYASGSMAVTVDKGTLVTANMLSDTVSIIDARQRQILAEIPVGHDPRSVALTPDRSRALVVNRGDGTLSMIDMTTQTVVVTHPVGVLPYSVVSGDDQSAFVSLQGENAVIRLDLDSGTVMSRIPTPTSPAGLTLWGDFLYVTHLWTGDVSLIYLPQGAVIQTVSPGEDLSLSQSLTINPATGRAYLPQTQNNTGSPTQTYDTLVFPVVNVLDLGTLTAERQARIPLDIVDRPVNAPFAASLDPFRNWLYVINAGSNDLSVIDLNTGQALAHIPVGVNPRGLRLGWDNTVLYVHNMIEGSVTVIETRTLEVFETFLISTTPVPIERFIGARLFNTATDPRMSRDNLVSCANCHFDGQSDGRVWRFSGQPRNTPSLYGLSATAPYTWTGDWADLTEVNGWIRDLQAGRGFLNETHNSSAIDLDLLVSYLRALETPPAPMLANLTMLERGAALFKELDCAACHSGDMGTDGLRHNVGTGGEFDTPALIGLWMSAPYFHDGRAITLRDLFILPGTHQVIGSLSLDDLDSLSAYLLHYP